MPTDEEWEGMGRKVDMAERKSIQAEADFIRTTPAAQLIAREAFKEGIEAAANAIWRACREKADLAIKIGKPQEAMVAQAQAEWFAAAIRKLRKE